MENVVYIIMVVAFFIWNAYSRKKKKEAKQRRLQEEQLLHEKQTQTQSRTQSQTQKQETPLETEVPVETAQPQSNIDELLRDWLGGQGLDTRQPTSTSKPEPELIPEPELPVDHAPTDAEIHADEANLVEDKSTLSKDFVSQHGHEESNLKKTEPQKKEPQKSVLEKSVLQKSEEAAYKIDTRKYIDVTTSEIRDKIDEDALDFDLEDAVIFSEILNRKYR